MSCSCFNSLIKATYIEQCLENCFSVLGRNSNTYLSDCSKITASGTCLMRPCIFEKTYPNIYVCQGAWIFCSGSSSHSSGMPLWLRNLDGLAGSDTHLYCSYVDLPQEFFFLGLFWPGIGLISTLVTQPSLVLMCLSNVTVSPSGYTICMSLFKLLDNLAFCCKDSKFSFAPLEYLTGLCKNYCFLWPACLRNISLELVLPDRIYFVSYATNLLILWLKYQT